MHKNRQWNIISSLNTLISCVQALIQRLVLPASLTYTVTIILSSCILLSSLHLVFLFLFKYGPRLTLSSFISMMQDTSMLEPEQDNICVASFLEAQLNPPVSWELEDLVFCEFMEAAARVAVKVIEKYKGSTFTDAKRIRMAFNFLTEMQQGQQSEAKSHK